MSNPENITQEQWQEKVVCVLEQLGNVHKQLHAMLDIVEKRTRALEDRMEIVETRG